MGAGLSSPHCSPHFCDRLNPAADTSGWMLRNWGTLEGPCWHRTSLTRLALQNILLKGITPRMTMSLPRHSTLLPRTSVNVMEAAAGAKGWCTGEHCTCKNTSAPTVARTPTRDGKSGAAGRERLFCTSYRGRAGSFLPIKAQHWLTEISSIYPTAGNLKGSALSLPLPTISAGMVHAGWECWSYRS